MSQTFIAAYDGSAASRAAVRLAVELARRRDAAVIAVHVYQRLAPAGIRGGVFDTERQQELHDRGLAVLEGLDVEGVARRILLAGSPAQELHDLAEDEGAALLVVGTTHRGRAGRLLPGSVASNLLHGAPCPVLVVPEEADPSPIRTIAVAYDEGPQAEAALRHAQTLAAALGARLRLIAAYDLEISAGPSALAAGDLDRMLRGDLDERLRARAEAIAGIEVEIRVVAGAVGRALADEAQDADLLVTGSRGYGPRHSVLVGGVSRHLVDNAPCPVLVVPRVPEREARVGAAQPTAAQPA